MRKPQGNDPAEADEAATPGEILASQIRAEANKLSDVQREELDTGLMAFFYGGGHDKPPIPAHCD